MLYLKATPTGIDDNLQLFQKKLYDNLKARWGLSDAAYECFGRAYRNLRDGRYVPEVYVGANEYREVMFDDTKTVQSFFGVGEQEGYNGALNAQVYLVFMVNVAALKPSLVHRGDEEVRVDAEKVCTMNPYGFKMTGAVTGLDKVFQEYQIYAGTNMTKCDMHPFHCFRLNFSMNYSIFNC